MNKKAIRVAGWALCLSMAVVGIGTTVGNNSQKTQKVDAASYSSVSSLTAGDVVVFAYEKDSTKKELTGVNSNIGTATNYSTSGSPNGTYKLTVEAGTTDGSFAFKNGDNYLSYTGSGNNLYTATEKSDSTSWTIKSGSAAGSMRFVNVNYTSRYLVYNASNPRWCCYGSSQTGFTVYKYSQTLVTSITLNKSSIDLVVGGSNETLSVSSILPSNADDKTYTWSSSDPSVATVSNGTVSAVAAGSTTIKATANDGSGVFGACVVTVTTANQPRIDISGSSSVYKGNTITLTATPNNFSPSSSYTWTSSNTDVATVDSSGKVTGVAKGSANITVSAYNGETPISSSVFAVEVKDFSIAASVASIESKASKATAVTITPTDAAGDVTITASSDNTSIATASVDGTTVTVTTGEYGGVNTNIRITANDGVHNSNEIVIPVTVEVGYAVGSKITSLPAEDTLVYLIANNDTTPKYVTSSINTVSTDDSEAALFYLSSTGTLKLKDSNPAAYVYNGGGNTTVSSNSNPAQWSSGMSNGTYPGLLQLSGGRFLSISGSDVKAYASSNLGDYSNIYAYAAVATVPTCELNSTTVSDTIGVTDTTSYTLTNTNFTPSGITITYKDDGEDEYAASSEIASVSCGYAVGSNAITVNFNKVGTTTVKFAVAGAPSGTIEQTMEVTVLPAPTAVNVKVGGSVVDSEYTLSRIVGGYKQPTVEILPAAAKQDYTLSVQSESVSGAFTVDGDRINYVKVATGVIRISSNENPEVYFDLKVEATPDVVTSITAEAKYSYYVGSTITKDDIVLKAMYEVAGEVTVPSEDYEFEDYTFTYADAPSGGVTDDTKQFNISFGGQNCTMDVDVSRAPYETPETSTLAHTGSEFKTAGITDGGVSDYGTYDSVTVDGITFAAAGYVYGSSLSLNDAKGNAPGYLYNKTAYSADISSISLSGSNFSNLKIWLSEDGTNFDTAYSSSTCDTGNYRYFKLKFDDPTDVGSNKYCNLSSIAVTLKGEETAETLRDYVMYEDTDNQCTTKFSKAASIFLSLSSAERSTFMTSEDVNMTAAKDRFVAWAANQGKTVVLVEGDYTINGLGGYRYQTLGNSSSSSTLTLVAAIAGVGLVTLVGGSFLLRKKKED